MVTKRDLWRLKLHQCTDPADTTGRVRRWLKQKVAFESCQQFEEWRSKQKLPDYSTPVVEEPKVSTQQLWLELHNYAVLHREGWSKPEAIQWYNSWLKRLPTYCNCQESFAQLCRKNPPKFDDPPTFFRWTWEVHNAVNRKLGKPELEWKNALASYWGVAPCTRPNLLISVATGPFYQYYHTIKPSLEHYADKINADLICLVNESKDWWGYEKFRVHEFVKQYDRTLFADSDLVITPTCPNVFDMVPFGDVGIHDDYPWIPYRDWMYPDKREVCESQGWYDLPIHACLNTGFVLCNRYHNVWRPPEHKLPEHRHCAEQFYIEQVIAREGYTVTQLPIELNTQWWMHDFRKLLPYAQVVHLANSPQKKEDLTEAMDKYFYNYSNKTAPDPSNISSKW